jgi:uroporphyrinogen-III synthase
MSKKEVGKRILALLKSSSRPLSTREISATLKVAWHTADRYCLKLKIKHEVDCFTIGKATAWYLQDGGAKNSKRISKHLKK